MFGFLSTITLFIREGCLVLLFFLWTGARISSRFVSWGLFECGLFRKKIQML
ncbi:hypothetical protein D3C76_551210 [compost metagenome]